MTSYTTTTATDKRAAAAAELVKQHLAHRDDRLIWGRVTRTGVRVWIVNGHAVTLDPVATCDCGDMLHRHPARGCKHIQAVRLLTAKPPQVGITDDPAAVVAERARRDEWQEEV